MEIALKCGKFKGKDNNWEIYREGKFLIYIGTENGGAEGTYFVQSSDGRNPFIFDYWSKKHLLTIYI